MIELTTVTKRFGATEVLRGISLSIAPGSALAILGPNASGKTTLLKCMLGLTRPDSGQIRINGIPIGASAEYRRWIGYMPQHPHFPENLRAAEVIELVKQIRGLSAPVEAPYIEQFRLTSELHKPIRALSGGTRQKLSAVLALMSSPSILILDEPTAGLDPLAAHTLKTELQRCRQRGCTLVLTTHVLNDIPELVTEVVFLLEGRIVFRESVPQLFAESNSRHFSEALVHRLQRS